MMTAEKPLAAFMNEPQPVYRSVTCFADRLASPEDVAQLICRLSYLDALTVARFVGGDVDKIIDGARSYLIQEQANVEG